MRKLKGTFDIIIFFAALTGLVFLLKKVSGMGRNIQKGQNETLYFDDLKNMVSEMLNDYVSFSDRHPEFTGKLRENTDITTYSVTRSIRECCSGAGGAREVVCELIKDYLRLELKLDAEAVRNALPEDDPVTVMYHLIRKLDCENVGYGFKILWDDFLRGRVGNGKSIEKQDIIAAKEYFGFSASDEERAELLSELLYAYTVGLGAVDVLNWQKGCIEEIQLGLSGVAKGLYDYRDELDVYYSGGKSRKVTSKDSVHVVIAGKLYRLSFITFGTEDEVIRILRNLIKDSVSPELTRKNPMIVTDTADGRRISVSRPPFTDAWTGLIRKFDTVRQTSIEELVEDRNAVAVLNRIASDNGNVAITGEMATGKTTLLRAMLLKVGEERSIRVLESESFELNVREYLPDANSLTLRISEEYPEDTALAFSKKTTGQVFAVGEICSPAMANLVINISKTATKVLFTAHYKTTGDMVADFASARINAGGFSDGRAAYDEAVHTLKYDVHLTNRKGIRRVEYINEVAEDGSIQCLYKAS